MSELPRESRLFLHDIISAAENVARIVSKHTFHTFSRHRDDLSAVLWNLTIIGEAVSQVPAAVKERHADVPWRVIQDFRNVVVHRYFTVDVEKVWQVATTEMKLLRTRIKKVLREEAKSQDESRGEAA